MRLPLLCLALVIGPAVANSTAAPTLNLVLENHRFLTPHLTAPAGTKIIVDLVNKDGSADEFDSSDLKVEEDITPHGHVRFAVGPLKPGVYRFMGEAHPATAEGTLTVTP